MKLGIVTWFHYYNYGTALQVYALHTYLTRLGHEVDVIRYYPQRMGKVLPDYSFHTTVKNVMRHRLAKLVPRNNENHSSSTSKGSSRGFKSVEKDTLFDVFLEKSVRFSPICETLSDLESLNEKYDGFICGSDQIWAPSVFDPHFFLDFVKDTNKLISYAPSIGLPKVEDKLVYRQMSELIGRIRYLSVREEKGAQIIKDMTGRKASVVTDPTLLIPSSQWKQMCKESDSSDSYLIVYMLGREENHWHEIYRIAEQKQLKVKVIPVFEKDLVRDGCITYPVGPVEFLTLFKNAAYVCTDSFHGTIFSILFHRQFSTFERFSKDDRINQNSRIYNLLNATGTSNRLIPFGGTYEYIASTDYSAVDNSLEKWVTRSKQFLSESLIGVLHGPKQAFPKHVLGDHTLCCGCGACAHVCPVNAIHVKMNAEGFYRASIDEELCMNCGKCRTVCQFESDTHSVKIDRGHFYSYKDNDSSVLLSSSSGGAAYRLAAILMDAGYVIAGCTFDISCQKARHILIEQKEGLRKLQGSKYMQSSFAQIIPQIAESDKPVAVFGTPCQIAAVRKTFPRRKDIVYVDLICHGVPSYNLFRKYKQYLSQNYGSNPEAIQIYNRYKPKGWRLIHTYTSDGKIETCFNQKEDLYFRMFESMNCYSPACYDCKWRDGTMADLRLGDFWGPLFEEDHTGVSLISCMTEKGSEIIDLLWNSNAGTLESRSAENYLRYQQTKNYPKPIFYDELIRRLGNHKIDLSFIVEKYAEPFEKQPVLRDQVERRKHIIRLMLDEYKR